VTLQVLPHSEETERAVLACVLLSPRLLDVAAGLLRSPEVFYLDRHRLVWTAYLQLRHERTEIDLRTVQAALEGAGVFDKVGGMAYLSGLDLELPVGGLDRMHDYCSVLLDRWAKRRLYAAGVALSEASVNGDAAELAITATAAELDAIARDRAGQGGALSMAEVFDAFDPETAGTATGIPSGLRDLDEVTGGFRSGQLIVVAARPGMGKTSFACQLASAAAASGHRVRFHSLEMTAEEIRNVMIAQKSGIPARSIVAGRMDPHERARAVSAAADLATLGELIEVDPTPALTPGQIWAAASLAKLRHGLDLLIIDSLGLVRYVGTERDMRLKLGAITAGAKEQAKTLEVPVVLLHHLSRSHEHEKRAPRMRDLIETASIERDADVVVFPYRPGDYLEEDDPKRRDWDGKALFMVEKNRGGPRGGAAVVAWNAPRQLFSDLSTRQEVPF
jgi:replicative DNA helicase